MHSESTRHVDPGTLRSSAHCLSVSERYFPTKGEISTSLYIRRSETAFPVYC